MKSKTRNLSPRKVSKKGKSRAKARHSKKNEPKISGSGGSDYTSSVSTIPIEEQCRDFFNMYGRIRKVKYIARYCKTSEKEIRHLINGLKLQTLLESLALQNQDLKKIITPILDYIHIRIKDENENTNYNYLSVKFDTKKHSKLDKFFDQSYCLTDKSKLNNLIKYCNLHDRDIINILLRNSLNKYPDAKVYREQVCSLIEKLKREEFTPKDLKTIQKNCDNLITEKTQTKRSKKGKKNRKTSNSNSSSNSPKSRKPIEKNLRIVPKGHVRKFATTHNTPSPLASSRSSSRTRTRSRTRTNSSSTSNSNISFSGFDGISV